MAGRCSTGPLCSCYCNQSRRRLAPLLAMTCLYQSNDFLR